LIALHKDVVVLYGKNGQNIQTEQDSELSQHDQMYVFNKTFKVMLILIFIIFYNGRDNNSVISLHNKLLIIMKIVYQYLIIVEGVQLTVIYID
jgi:hypothetical protein